MSIKNESNNLSSALFGKTRRAVLSLLYSHPNETFYLSSILRIINSGHGAVQRELKQLTEAGILRRLVQGRQVYYQANPDSPVFRGLRSIMVLSEKPTSQIASGHRKASMVSSRFTLSKREIAKFCRKYHIKKLALFGSILRQDFRPDSDIDVLVEFEPGHVPGFGIVAIEQELSKMAGRKVDLRTPGDLSRYFREQVVKEAEVRYAAS